ncbi:hypothetical protein [Paenibacillus daejeonensis]|uniref:hypothetical protein n=1 Tax=Paenibacillus daejeonensis TaxID=135193 RepID=UPI00036B8C3E|nr:hypothetical protein [Paenibacillus daejeonensis]
MNVLRASLRRIVNRGGVICGEVEVKTDDPECPVMLAYMAPAYSDEYEMIAVLGNDADMEIDWYDNNLHDAFTDQTTELLQDAGGSEGMESFKAQILASGVVREDLARELSR